MKTVALYLTTMVLFFAIDLVWIGWLARNFYREKIGFLLADQINWTAALIFYLLYIGGILYFAILPALRSGNSYLALLNGAILGLLCYATYDLTNLATLKDWPLSVTLGDLAWGTFLTGSTAFAATALRQWWG